MFMTENLKEAFYLPFHLFFTIPQEAPTILIEDTEFQNIKGSYQCKWFKPACKEKINLMFRKAGVDYEAMGNMFKHTMII